MKTSVVTKKYRIAKIVFFQADQYKAVKIFMIKIFNKNDQCLINKQLEKLNHRILHKLNHHFYNKIFPVSQIVSIYCKII